MVVARGSREDRLLYAVTIFRLRYDCAALRPKESLVGTEGHQVGSFPEGVLELPACDETGNMSGIIARDGSNLSDDLAQFAHGLGEEQKAASEHHYL